MLVSLLSRVSMLLYLVSSGLFEVIWVVRLVVSVGLVLSILVCSFG